MNTYENVTKHTLEIPNIGLLKPGEQLKTTRVIENPNLKLVQSVPATPPKSLEDTVPAIPKLTEANSGNV